MSVSFTTDYSKQRAAIEESLERFTQPESGCPARLADAIRYSTLTPGKRMRPLLVLLACEAVGGDWEAALPAACAVEFIHVYSLIHDDLPAMDNDELRRGKPTCHRQFDEATAILAGDSLQMLAFEVLCENLPENRAFRCCRLLAKYAGRSHLVGGQADDLAAEGRFGESSDHRSADFLQQIHLRKTGALIVASLQLGGVMGGASESEIATLGNYGRSIGLAFQIVDDCLDIESTPEKMGKMTRKDENQGKLTYPNLLGLEESKQFADKLISDAIRSVSVFESQGQSLVELAKFVAERRS